MCRNGIKAATGRWELFLTWVRSVGQGLLPKPALPGPFPPDLSRNVL